MSLFDITEQCTLEKSGGNSPCNKVTIADVMLEAAAVNVLSKSY